MIVKMICLINIKLNYHIFHHYDDHYNICIFPKTTCRPNGNFTNNKTKFRKYETEYAAKLFFNNLEASTQSRKRIVTS